MSNPSPSTWENTRHADDSSGHDNSNVDNDDDFRRDGDHEVIPVYLLTITMMKVMLWMSE